MDTEARIYVAGHRGLVGSAILRRLREQGYGNLITRSHRELDLTDGQAVAGFFAAERPEHVFLAAARVGGIHANNTYPADFIRENLAIQLNIIHQSYVTGVQRLLFLGSSCIYPRLCPQPIREEYLLTGPLETTNSAYAVAKIAGIEMCGAYNRQHKTCFIPVMPTNLYGPGDSFNLETSHVLPALIRKFHLAALAARNDLAAILRDEKTFGTIPADIRRALGYDGKSLSGRPHVLLWGTGTARREFLHVDDMAAACIHLMRRYESTDLINIGTGSDVTIAEAAELVRRITGFSGEVRFDASKPDGTPRKVLDVGRLTACGWRAAIGLEEGIRGVYDWYLRQEG
ncbi:MAG: GDP-L-fucose synthase [Thermodesulfobacteriota bacterium]